MDDKQILDRIHELVGEEHTLRTKRQSGEVEGDDERERLARLETTLDQCWDLLRRRRALSEFGSDPDAAQSQPVRQVEDYLQ